MRLPIVPLMIGVVVAFVLVFAVGTWLVAPPQALILAAGFAPERITPNADGSDDVTIFAYDLSRNASITVTFRREDGTTFRFRENVARTVGESSVAFSGVVDGYLLPGENVEGEVLRRLMPDGVYTWTMEATAEDGATEARSGTLTLADGDATLPQIPEFTVFPNIFTPNQDGISDRTGINVGLLEQADLSVTLQRDGIEPIYVPERLETQNPDQPALRHLYDYEGGVDLGASPPPDGDYTVVALAQDEVGQQVRRTATLTIASGGQPLAQILPQPTGATIVFEQQAWEERYSTTAEQPGDLIASPDDPQSLNLDRITMVVGDLLVFKLTVENYGETAIRTHGSPPGTVYDWNQRAATFDETDESGAWRVGIDCDTATVDYPWRWALGTFGNDGVLVEAVDPSTETAYTYLPAGARSVVWGAIRMSEIQARNPQNCWAGLIHEDVGVNQLNTFVGPRSIQLLDPDGATSQP